MANLWVYGAHQGHCYSGVTENLCVRRRKPTDTTEILTISKHSVVTPTAGSAAGYQTKPAALSRCHLNRPLTRSDKSHSRGCSDIKKRLSRLNRNDLNKLFSLLRSNFARMKTRQKGGMLTDFSVHSWWGVQDIVDFGPMKVQAEWSDVHFCHDFHPVRLRRLDISDRLLRQSSGS